MLPQSLNEARDFIDAFFPEFKGEDADTHLQGQQSWTFLFRDKVVKIPKNSAVFEGIAHEETVLAKLADNPPPKFTTLNIPEILYFDGQNPIQVLGRLPGTPVDFCLAANPIMAEDVGERLGRFLAHMHDCFAISCTESKAEQVDFLSNVRAQALRAMAVGNQADQVKLQSVIDYIDAFDEIEDGWTIIHHDVSVSNLVFDFRAGFGLVDFTSALPFYRHMDFARIAQKFPPEVISKALDTYEEVTGIAYARDLIQTASDFRHVLTSPVHPVNGINFAPSFS